MIWLPLLALGAGVAVVATSKPGGPRAQTGQCCGTTPEVGRAPVQECLSFAWQPEEVDAALEHALAEHDVPTAGWGEVALATVVANHVYDHTPDGEAINWPPVAGDCPSVMAIWGRIVIRVRRHLAALEDGAADQAWWDSGGR